ncbi:MAG: extracellular solute-binding protein [Treponemataceae bacterium]
MRKPFFVVLSALFGALSLASAWAAPKVVVSHALTIRGEPKYKAGFKNFDYVRPDAPKGGTVVMHAIGTYDNFNRYALRGVAAAASTAFYDTLMIAPDDEIDVYYGLIAEKVEYPESHDWIIFHINPKARHQDGKRITSADVVFTFNTFMEKGVPQFKQYFKKVAKVEAIDELRVKFTLAEGDKELLVALAGLTILPKHYWESRNFSEPLAEVPLGSGGFTVKDFKMGQYVVYERVKNYWAADLPVNKGLNNFDKTRYDYYRDDTVALEAFKAGEYDFRMEGDALNWATKYTGAAFAGGTIKKEEIPHQIPEGMRAFVFNIQRPIFKDRRVREALNYMLDFEWINANLLYGEYTRTRSFFQNTKYAATALPDAAERKILEPIKDKIPKEVFSKVYEPPKTDGSGTIRPQIRAALALLKEAGWELKSQKLVDPKTGKPLEFELLIYSPNDERIAIPLKKNLERIGVTLNIRTVDTTQFTKRLRDRDFDMIISRYSTNYYPDSGMKITWRSDFIDSTYNTAGVQDPAVDYLIDGIAANQQNEDALLAWGRALDRVLTWNHYVIPQWYLSKFRVAYKDKFSRPPKRPTFSLGQDSWWIDTKKEAALKAGR